MLSRLLLLACAGAACMAAEPQDRGIREAGAAPWTISFTTTVRGKDRQFVESAGKTYLLSSVDEIATGAMDGQDVAFAGKLHRLPGDVFGCYRIDGLVIAPQGNVLAGKLDGDNAYLAGSLTAADGKRVLKLDLAAQAPSDAQLLQAQLAGIPDDAWERRLGVVSWCHEQARTAGNADSWTATGDALLGRIISDMAAMAGERRDAALLTRAIDLTLNQTKDPGLAARLASAAWLRDHGGAPAEAIARRMHGLGFALYKQTWLPRPQALEQEFSDRFAALSWKDAKGYYTLGRWADDNAEALPRARELSWRCYQAGNKADPSNPDIARELGIQPTAEDTSEPPPAGGTDAIDFLDLTSGLRVPAPAGWKRGRSATGDTAWIDPDSDTALLSVKALRPPVDVPGAWRLVEAEAQARSGFAEVGSLDETRGEHHLLTLRSTWQEGDQVRYAAVVLVDCGDGKPAAIIEARGLPSDRQRLDPALDAAADGVTVHEPATTVPEPDAAPAEPGADAVPAGN